MGFLADGSVVLPRAGGDGETVQQGSWANLFRQAATAAAARAAAPSALIAASSSLNTSTSIVMPGLFASAAATISPKEQLALAGEQGGRSSGHIGRAGRRRDAVGQLERADRAGRQGLDVGDRSAAAPREMPGIQVDLYSLASPQAAAISLGRADIRDKPLSGTNSSTRVTPCDAANRLAAPTASAISAGGTALP